MSLRGQKAQGNSIVIFDSALYTYFGAFEDQNDYLRILLFE